MATGNEETLCPMTKDHISPLCDFALPVVPGQPIAKLNQDHLPDAIPPDSDKKISYQEANLECDPKAATLTATAVGMLEATPKGMLVVPLWSTSDDGQTLSMDFFPTDCFGKNISDDKYRSALPDGCRGVDNDALDDAVAKAQKENTPVKGIKIAKGQLPLNGRDGEIQLKFRKDSSVGEVKKDGTVDFRERGGTFCVGEGDEIAILIPPTNGVPGFDVLGNEIPAENGQPQTIKAGNNVTASDGDGGTTVFTAAVPGMVVYKEGSLAISDVLEINSDVDLASGNVHVAKGSILIKGTVTTGTEVSAEENVVVDVVVENAIIKAGADVNVGGGILMEEGGLIEAGGNVTAKFIRNATIHAGGDVVVDVDIANCDIVAGGRIIAESDKGIVNGGNYVCAGMNVAEVGTDTGTLTSVTLALPGSEDPSLDQEDAAIRERIDELGKFIGTEDPKKTLLMAPKEDRAIIAELFKIKAHLLKELANNEKKKDEMLMAQSKELAKIKLRARKTTHAGVTINIGDRSITLNKAEQASKFHWDAEQCGIAITGL
ncbi:FapA family protein [uncultured Pseudodesulfovibrio sp.]|uniref:DUF342 domain-containing protein n=1 Tax=uncultured Pseudodesulfovibrio sp. TaxID=2035858 RepID=UPI0029C8C743|nr:FapA family protein [uncultured Pseudodesulfovibrio sp.]